MASPAPEAAHQNGISTPPANNATNTPPTQTQAPSFAAGVAGANGTGVDAAFAKKPRDARLVHLLLAQMGVHAYSERVPLQLLDFAYRYTSSILSDAQSYEPPAPTSTSTSTKKKRAGPDATDDDALTLAALRTAVAARSQGSMNAWLPKEFMAEVAGERNRVALPRVDREFGMRMPPERYCFTGVGWGLERGWEEDVEEEGGDVEMDGDEVGFGDGGPVGGEEGNGEVEMGGMGGEGEMDLGDVDEDEFEEAMGGN